MLNFRGRVRRGVRKTLRRGVRLSRRYGFSQNSGVLEDFQLEYHLDFIFNSYQINCVLDVGANRGEYARHLRAGGYAGQILSFEPVRESFETLEARSEKDPRWRVFNWALGSEEGEREIQVTHLSNFSSFLSRTDYSAEQFGKRSEVKHIEKATVRRLEGLWEEVLSDQEDPRVFLKMDTQGFDVEVFSGAGDRNREVVALQSEMSVIPVYRGMPSFGEALAVYESAGFSITGIFPVTREERTSRVVEFDCVMVRPEGLGNSG